MSSTTPEAHNISQRRRRRTEPRPQATCTKHLVKIARVVQEISSRTDRHRHTHTQTYSSPHHTSVITRTI